MAKEVDVEEVAKRNPPVDVAQLREAQALMEDLRKHGLNKPGYNLTSPYETQAPQRRKDMERHRPDE